MNHLFVMGFIPSMKYNDASHKAILGHQIKENTDWIVAYDKFSINYVVGNIWNNLTHNFEPGPDANLVASGKITQDDTNNINNACKTYNKSDLIFLLGHKYKNDYNNNNWYRNDTLSNTPTTYNNNTGNIPHHYQIHKL
eukprot:551215_1